MYEDELQTGVRGVSSTSPELYGAAGASAGLSAAAGPAVVAGASVGLEVSGSGAGSAGEAGAFFRGRDLFNPRDTIFRA